MEIVVVRSQSGSEVWHYGHAALGEGYPDPERFLSIASNGKKLIK
jgi:hypothetical protein